MRKSEALGLRWNAINFEEGTLSIVTTVVKEKQGKEIKTVVKDNTTKTESSMRTLLLCPYTYQYFTALWQKTVSKAALRHSCATIMLYLGYTLKDIQTWLGHSNYHFIADTYIQSGIGVHGQMAEKLSEKLGVLLPENPVFQKI